MIPVTDSIRARRFPIVNVSIIVTCILVFLYELTLGSEADIGRFFTEWGVVPKQLMDWLENPSSDHLGEPASVVTSAFVHGGWLHLIGNMLYLWVFGDNVEDVLGHLRYALFYVLGAIGAVAAQVAIDVDETVPMVGASGAIAAVLGAYLILYPKARVGVLLFVFILPVPAFVLIVLWFVMQLFSGVATLGETEATQTVAVWAHIGGFATGFALMLLLRPFVRVRPQSELSIRRGFRS